MADFRAIAAAARSVERLLNHCFDEDEPVPGRATKAVLIRTSDLENANVGDTIVALPSRPRWAS